MFNSVELIRQICKDRGIAISKLEKELGYGNGYLNPKKQAKIPYDRAVEIAQYLSLPVEYILTGHSVELAKSALIRFTGKNPDSLSGARLEVLFEASGHDLEIVCFNLEIDQGYLNSWIEDNDLPPKPIVDKILGVFRLKPEDLLAKKELADYRAESAEWEGIEKAPTVFGKRLSDGSATDDLTSTERELIRKFRCLDDRGQAAVLNVLSYEYDSLPGEKAHTAPKEA